MVRRTAKQRIASRRNLAKARARRRVIKGVAAVGTAAVLGTAIYKADQKINTIPVYHATTHARAKRIHTQGYKTKHRKRAYANHRGSGPMHETGRVFISTSTKAIKSYGPAVLSGRVRKSKFKKYAKQDVHPLTLQGEKYGFKSRNKAHYHMQVSDMRKAGLKLRYTKAARKNAGKRIHNRYAHGSLRSQME